MSVATVPLGDLLAEIRPGFASGDDLEHGVFQIRMNNLARSGDLMLDRRRRVSPDQKQVARFLLQPGDVLFNSTNSPDLVGKTAFFPGCEEPVVFSNHFLRLRPHTNQLDPQFLSRWLQHQFQRGYFRTRCKQWVNQASFGQDRLITMEIPLPPIEEQRRIAAVLDAADALRAKRRQALAKLDTLTQAIFIERLGQFGGPSKLEDHVTFLTSGARGWAEYYAETGSRFVRSLDVRMNEIGNADVAYVKPPETAEARRIRVSAGDVLLTITGSRIGRAAEAPTDLEGSYISQHVAIIRTDASSLNPSYLSMWLAHPSGGQRQISSKQYGQTKPGLNFDQIRSFELPVPSLDVQRHLMVDINAVRETKAGASQGGIQLDRLFASLQQRAFRGDL